MNIAIHHPNSFLILSKLLIMDCSICKTEITGNFCSTCGQSYISDKKNTLVSVILNFFSIDKNFLFTLFAMLKSPKTVVLNYNNGFRNYFHSPGVFVTYAILLISIHLAFVNNDILGLYIEAEDFAPFFVFVGLFYPMLSLSSYLTFRRTKRKYVHHLVSIIYIGSSFLILLSIYNTIQFFFSRLFEAELLFIFLLLVIVYNSLVFSSKPGVLRVIGNSIIQLVIMIFIISLFLFTLFLIDPGMINIKN